jgi:hypothetical protein
MCAFSDGGRGTLVLLPALLRLALEHYAVGIVAVEFYFLDSIYAGYLMLLLYGESFSCYVHHHHQAILALRKSASLHPVAASL